MSYLIFIRELIRSVCSFCLNASNIAITNSVVHFKDSIIILQSKLAAIDLLFAQRSLPISGYAAQKNAARIALAERTFAISNACRNYALRVNDLVLASQTRTSLGVLRNMPYKNISAKVIELINIVTPQIVHLAPDVVPADLIAWNADLTTFRDLMTAPNIAKQQRKSINQQIVVAVRDAARYLRSSVDSAAALFSQTNPAFYTSLKAVEKLQRNGIHHTRFSGTITNEIGTPYIGVQCTVDAWTDPNDGRTFEAVSGYTDMNGNVIIKEFFPATRTITVSGDGIVTTTFGPYEFEKGAAVSQILVCQPEFSNIPASTPQLQTTPSNN